MKAVEQMTIRVRCVMPSDTISDAYQMMKEIGSRHLPVVKNQMPIGIISDRDILLVATGSKSELILPDVTCQDVMTKPVISCSQEARIGDVADQMIEHQVDSIIVTNQENQVKGIITSMDLLALLRRMEGVSDVDVGQFEFID